MNKTPKVEYGLFRAYALPQLRTGKEVPTGFKNNSQKKGQTIL